MTAAKAAGGILIACLLAGCTGSGLSLSDSTPVAQQPQAQSASLGMKGRWILSAPNAPSCGMAFGGTPDAKDGSIAPEGGCPGKFFTSRRWVKTDTGLTIDDHENNPLAQLTPTPGGGFEGKATSGMPVTLRR